MAEAVNLYDLDRKERGAILANEFDVEQSHRGWRVPSQSGNGNYVVTIEDDTKTCTCPDFDHRGPRTPFDRSCPDQPVVFSTTQTRNGGQPVVTRQAAVSTTGFDCRLQEEEALGAHVTETVGYLAVEQGAGTAGGIEMEAGRTPDSVTDNPYGIDFTQGYDRTPTVLCAMQTADGSDTATLRTVARDSAGIEVRVEEEESADDETSHTAEAVGYLAIGGDRLVGS
jgi:hypothetical protein